MDDDEVLALPADTLRLLQEFQAEKDARDKQFQDLKAQAESKFEPQQNGRLSMELFGEDWNASQFWYTDATATVLARQLLDGATHESAIAVVSAPSVYVQLRNILSDQPPVSRPRLCLLEFDRRFEVLGSDFVYYDYEQPLNITPELKGRFERIICDPPFLSEDCQAKTALTTRFLAKDWVPAQDYGQAGLRLISCTGERMEEIITKKLYSKVGVKTTTFEPEHAKGLSNEFRCYANFECANWTWRKGNE